MSCNSIIWVTYVKFGFLRSIPAPLEWNFSKRALESVF